mmetsp:Transcript_19064/g.25121  ORF Transcript_19064/g.25121 Transcript_19064/m.25121 type:complete len:363 (-) Transcript_19064:15-1103(-)
MEQENEPLTTDITGYGQVVIGPPGSGKTTYCFGMAQYLQVLGRKIIVINLDPANEYTNVPYTDYCKIDISELVCLQEVMDRLLLGPNGGLVYCMEYLQANMDWLVNKLKQHQPGYFIFDLPGQVELFTHNESVQNIVSSLVKAGLHLTTVNLIDAFHCSDAARFISATLLSLTTMLRLELPHVNVLSKVDLIESYGQLAFNMDFFTDVIELDRLLDYLQEDPIPAMFDVETEKLETEEESIHKSKPQSKLQLRFNKLHRALCEIIEEFGLVSYWPLNIEDKETVGRILAQVDKSNGFVFMASKDNSKENVTKANAVFRSVYNESEPRFECTGTIQEKYTSYYDTQHKSELSELGMVHKDETT